MGGSLRLHERRSRLVTFHKGLLGRVFPLSSFFSVIASPIAASCLLVLFILLSVLGTVIPQEAIYPRQEFLLWLQENPSLAKLAESLWLTRLYTSATYIIVTWLLMLSVGSCTVQRLFELLKTKPLDRPDINDPSFANHRWQFSFNRDAKTICRKVGRNTPGFFWRFASSQQDAGAWFVMDRGWVGIWGSLLFHVSFLVILIGSLTTIWTRAEGTVVLTEGQASFGEASEYVTGSAFSGRLPEPLPFQLTLTEVHRPEPARRGPTATVQIEKSAREAPRYVIGNFHALSQDGFTFYLQEQGYSPAFRITTEQGEVLFDGFVALKTNTGLGGVRFADTFMSSSGQLRIDIELRPGKEDSRPQLSLVVQPPGKPLKKTELFLGETHTVAGLVFVFHDLRFWSSFRVVQDQGVAVVYIGFLLGIVGLCLRVFVKRETLVGVVDAEMNGSRVLFAGCVEGDDALFRERFERYCQHLEERIKE